MNLNGELSMGKINKVALITGISGQDGSYLAELLLDKYVTPSNHGKESHAV